MITSLIKYLLLEHQKVTFTEENNWDFLVQPTRTEALEDTADLSIFL